MSRPSLPITVALGLLVCTASRSQAIPAAQTEFGVASIKASASDDPRTLLQVLPGGGLRVSGATLKFLITLAYEVRSFQILGGPAWITSERFDVMAKSENSIDPEKEPRDPSKVTAVQLKGMQDQMRPQLRALLEDRFRLSLRRETREQPVYALIIGKNGIKFHQATGNFRGLRIAKTQLVGSGATIEMLATALANQLGRPVLDHTNLEGSFDLKLEWADQAGAPSPPGVDTLPPADPNRPSIFTALQEQLGLKVESAKGPVEVLIVDHVERPSEN